MPGSCLGHIDYKKKKKKRFYLFIVLERGEGREKERGRNTSVRNTDQLPLEHTPMGDRPCNLGTRPDQESNPRSFTLQDSAQPAKPHWSGQKMNFLKNNFLLWNFSNTYKSINSIMKPHIPITQLASFINILLKLFSHFPYGFFFF